MGPSSLKGQINSLAHVDIESDCHDSSISNQLETHSNQSEIHCNATNKDRTSDTCQVNGSDSLSYAEIPSTVDQNTSKGSAKEMSIQEYLQLSIDDPSVDSELDNLLLTQSYKRHQTKGPIRLKTGGTVSKLI